MALTGELKRCELGVHFENSASEAAAAAMLAASVHYPIRGAVTFKSPVGINVASDVIANLASGGVTFVTYTRARGQPDRSAQAAGGPAMLATQDPRQTSTGFSISML